MTSTTLEPPTLATADDAGTAAGDAAMTRDDAELARLRAEVAHYRDIIRRTADACEQAAHGDLEARVVGFDEPGDTGRLMRSVNHILDVSDAFVRDATASLEHVSRARFFRRVLLKGMPGAYRHAAAQINAATHMMADRYEELQRTRERQLELASQFEQTIGRVVDTLASSATQMQATAESLTGRGGATAGAGSATTMGRLVERSHEIGSVTRLITQIAAATKLLALNATIEAARAGESGKGFAVVASEVKQLAQSTAGATDQITQHIHDMQVSTQEAATAIAAIGQAARDVSQQAETLTGSAVTFLETIRG